MSEVGLSYFGGEAEMVRDGPTAIGSAEYPPPRQNELPKNVEVWPAMGSQALRKCTLMTGTCSLRHRLAESSFPQSRRREVGLKHGSQR